MAQEPIKPPNKNDIKGTAIRTNEASVEPIILKTAVESRKSAQALDAPEKHEKALITK